MKGFRTLASAALAGAAGLTITLKDVLSDWGYGVRDLLAMLGIHDKAAGVIVLGLSIWFAWMRIISTTPVGQREEVSDDGAQGEVE